MPCKAPEEIELTEIVKALLEEWLKNPEQIAEALGLDESELKKMTPEELIQYFLDRLKDQTEAHHGGNRWIGTGGTSPVGHSGYHPGGMRVGGQSRNKSAVKVAMERRYKDYSQEGPLTEVQMGEALKRLRRMMPSGPKDMVNVDKTIYETMRNAGEIEIIFDRRSSGPSQDHPDDRQRRLVHGPLCRSRADPVSLCPEPVQGFENLLLPQHHLQPCLAGPAERRYKPEPIDDFIRKDPETRLIIVGDASMAPYELIAHERVDIHRRG